MYFFKKDKTGEIIDIVYSSKDITNEQFVLANDEYKIGDFILNGKFIHKEDYCDTETTLQQLVVQQQYELELLKLGIEV